MFSFRSQQPHLSETPIRGFFLLNVARPNPKMQAMALKNSVGAITILHALPVNQTPFLQNLQALYK